MQNLHKKSAGIVGLCHREAAIERPAGRVQPVRGSSEDESTHNPGKSRQSRLTLARHKHPLGVSKSEHRWARDGLISQDGGLFMNKQPVGSVDTQQE